LQEQPQLKKGLPDTWVLALFKKFQARYLHKWTSAIEGIEEVAVSEWSEELSGVTGDQVKVGLTNLPSNWPPTAGGFKDLCLKKGVNEYGLDYVPQMYRENRLDRLLDSDTDKEARKKSAVKGLADIRKLL